MHLAHVDDQVDALAGITPFVVIPGDELDEGIVQRDTSFGIENARAGFVDEVRRNDFVFGITKDALHVGLGSLFHLSLDLIELSRLG